MFSRALTVTAAIVATAANAQAPAPKAPSRPPVQVSAYCLPVSAGFLESETKAFEEMRKCSRGDTVVIPARSASSVARMCDFSKAIVTTGENIVCTMVSPERASK
jgi:hypothetical protein